jgi:hypothetical protein
MLGEEVHQAQKGKGNDEGEEGSEDGVHGGPPEGMVSVLKHRTPQKEASNQEILAFC